MRGSADDRGGGDPPAPRAAPIPLEDAVLGVAVRLTLQHPQTLTLAATPRSAAGHAGRWRQARGYQPGTACSVPAEDALRACHLPNRLR